MNNTKRLIAIVAMICATFLMVATSALPHHHHDDGAICLTLDWCQDDAAEHSHSHNSCDDDCAMNIDLLQDASQIGHASKVGLIPQLVAILTWDNLLFTEPEVPVNNMTFFFIERLYHGIVVEQRGLRAPPSVA